MNGIFNTVMLSFTQWLICFGCSILIIPLVEAQKAIMNKLSKDKGCE